MAVSDYLQKSSGTCRYSYSKLKDVLYLVSYEHLKDVQIDNGEAYISGLTELPLRINGFNIQFNEETSLDERYKFQKTLTLSMHGYVNYKIFGGRYYAIIEDVEGTFYMINVDFPSRITHTFNLAKDTNQTDFTFSSLSNFPTLKLNAEFEAVAPVCLGLNVYGIEKLQLIEKEKARLDTVNKTVVSTEDFKTIEFLGNSCSFQEVYDGFKVTDTIQFNIALNDYKPSFRYNLLEFLDNRYSAIITPRGNDNKYYPGYNFGLQPSYTIQTASNAGESDIITITLTESSVYGSTAAVDWSEDQSTLTRWRYVERVDDIITYECIGLGQARYLVKQQVDLFGNPTGNYQVLQGYQSQYQMFNVVGTFAETETFANNSCTDGGQCNITTTIPNTVTFTGLTCSSFTLKTSCDWSVSGVPSNITVSPTSGSANTTYEVSICNLVNPSLVPIENYFTINCCNASRVVNCIVSHIVQCIRPTTQSITCLGQNVSFTYNGNCILNVGSNPSGLTYNISNNTFTVQVPANTTTSARTFTLSVSNCNCSSASTTLTINQDKVYEKWVTDTGFLCESGNSYTVQRRYTGTTSGNVETRTDETRKGSLIQSGDTRCNSSQTKWEWDGVNYYCVDGNKFKTEFEYISYDGGSTWAKTGNTRLGDMVEANSEWCNSAVTYSWVLTSRYECSGTTSYYLYQKYEQRGEQDPIPVYPNYWSINGDGTQSLSKKMDNDPNCGYVPPSEPIYRWTNMNISTDYYCDDCPYYTKYLTFVATESGTFKFSGNSINYSLDNGNTWRSLSNNTDSPTVSAGNKIMWKSELTPTSNGIGSFSSTGHFAVEGNIMSLLYSDNFSEQTSLSGKNYAFYSLFRGCTTVTSAENLVLPATTLVSRCYDSMFSDCTSLTTAPVLSATTLANYCYSNMFYGCTSLTTAPVLPATTLASVCYISMFYGCTSLTTAPELPATTLATGCYCGMFKACTSLTTAPSLPATTLASFCYGGMFNGCTSLTTAPNLPATTLASQCYDNMFQGCTSLTTAPVLPATTLASYCYSYMFNGCTSLTTAPSLPATTLTDSCYSYMFKACTSLTAAPSLPATTLAEDCYNTMFQGCTSLTTAPSLPATTLATYCYYGMFDGCTSLTTAPTLPATTLASFCYQYMFYGCTRLNSITCLATNISASYCTNNWVNGVAASGTFTKAASMSSWTTGVNGIPSNWTIQNA